MLRAHLLVLVLALGACVTPTLARPSRASAAAPGQRSVLGPVAAQGALEVRIVNVGQGDGILIRGPDGRTILMDAGPGSGGAKVDAECRRLGIHRIDHAVITHAHLDHMGGFLRLLDKLEFGEFIDPGFPHPSKTYARLLAELERRKIPVRLARRGMEIPLGGTARLVLLAPEDPLFTGTRSDANANTVVARLEMGSVCMVFSGDAELETEERVQSSGDPLQCPVLKVAHHGSAHSTSEVWLDHVNPVIAVISAGLRNRYGHPAPSTLRRLEAAGAQIYRTDLHGTVVVRTDGERIMVTTHNEPPPTEPSAAGAAGTQPSNHASSRLASHAKPLRARKPAMHGSVDVNTATPEQLMALPGIGPKTAAAIVADRELHGPFSTVDDLVRVKGIGKGKLARVRPFVTAGSP